MRFLYILMKGYEMTEEKDKLTEEQKQEFLNCVKDTQAAVKNILDDDTRADYVSRIHFIARSIARLQPSDIEITQCLRHIIDAFNYELEDYSDFRKKESDDMMKSLNKFRESVGEEVEYFQEEEKVEERKLH